MRGVMLFVIALAGFAHETSLAEPAAPKRYTIEQLMAADTIAGLSFSPDGKKLLFTSTRTGLANIYEMTLPNGVPRALTHSTTETIAAIGYFPNDERILYSSDQGGNELNHVYVRERNGTSRDLTPGEKLKARFAGWAADGRSFYLVTNERDARVFDLYEYGVDGYERRRLFENDKGYQIEAVSPDRRTVALSIIRDNANTDALLYDVASKSLRQLTPDEGNIVSTPEDFSRDNGSLYYTTDEGHEFQYLVRLDLRTNARTTVLKTRWDVSSASLTQDGRYLVAALNEDARTTVLLFDPKTLRPLAMPGAGAGTIEGMAFAQNAPLAALVVANGNAPGDLYLVNLQSGTKTRLLSSLPAAVKQTDLVPGSVMRFKSYDGLEVPGVLYAPAGTKLPAVIWVHGGPGGESRIGFKPLTQYLVNQGYVVYEINNRGSSGSGKTFYHLDDRKHGEADLDDVVAAKKMLVAKGLADPNRVAIVGGSYGGYMVLAGLTFRPEVFAAGVDLYGVANWPRLLTNTPPWWEDLRRLLKSEMGDWEQDQEYLRKISPIFHAGQIKRPLLVLQGANDPRVLQQESDDIVAKVRANKVPAEYVIFPDEGHGFRKKANQLVAYRTIGVFLDKYVKNARPGAAE
jgi:dipeptidyl aminopeptidase/acylaminoacyl peptidase